MKKFTREFKFDQAIAFRNALLDLEKVEEVLTNNPKTNNPKITI